MTTLISLSLPGKARSGCENTSFVRYKPDIKKCVIISFVCLLRTVEIENYAQIYEVAGAIHAVFSERVVFDLVFGPF